MLDESQLQTQSKSVETEAFQYLSNVSISESVNWLKPFCINGKLTNMSAKVISVNTNNLFKKSLKIFKV